MCKAREVLEPLLANRQMYQEAVSIFYSLHAFVCESVEMLHWMLTKTPRSRTQAA